MKIKAPSFADLFAATSLELVLVRRIKFLESLIPLHNLKAVSNFTKSELLMRFGLKSQFIF